MTDRTLPHDEAAEVAVLGSALQNDKRVLAECLHSGLDRDAFYVPAHRMIFGAMLDIYIRGKVIDVLTLSDELKRGKELDRVGGMKYLEELIDRTPDAYHYDSYIEIVKDRSQRRKVIRLSAEASSRAYNLEEPSMDVITDAQDGFFQAASVSESAMTNVQAANIQVGEWKDAMGSKPPSLSCVLAGYERVIGGFRKGKTHYLAGSSSIGKTTLLKNQLRYLSWDLKIPTAFASIDDEHAEVIGSIACDLANVSKFMLDFGKKEANRAKRGTRLKAAHGALRRMLSKDDTGRPKFPLWINDKIMDFDQFEAWARYMVFRHKVEAIGLDYVQILGAGRRCKARTQRESLEYIGVQLRRLAKDLGVALFVITQITEESPAAGKKKNARPNPYALFGSRALYQSAYSVTVVFQDDGGDYVLECTKNKGGKKGDCNVIFRPERQRFEDTGNVVRGQGDLPFKDEGC